MAGNLIPWPFFRLKTDAVVISALFDNHCVEVTGALIFLSKGGDSDDLYNDSKG